METIYKQEEEGQDLGAPWYEKWYKDFQKDNIQGVVKIPTFIKELDEMLRGGLHPGEVFILSAPTKQGKTTLLQTISFNQSKNGFPVLWFSFEMSWQELTRTFYEIDTQEKTKEITPVPICYPANHKDLSLEWLEQVIIKQKEEKGITCVYIDHLHFLLPLGDFHNNISFLIGGIVREIKNIAIRQRIPIFLIAHMKKPADDAKIPSMNDVRDSSFISQETDFTAVMWRSKNKQTKNNLEDIYNNEAILSLEANRRTGKTGRIKLIHDGYKFNEYESNSNDLQVLPTIETSQEPFSEDTRW